jgi:hypothetical protein
MISTIKKTVSTSLFEDELEALDRVRECQQLSRAEAVREAVRWYTSARCARFPPTEDPLPDEVEGINQGQRDGGNAGKGSATDRLSSSRYSEADIQSSHRSAKG